MSSASVSPGPTVSPTLAINEAIRSRIRAGENIVHLGFGEAGVPVHPLLKEALCSASADGSYGDVAGSPSLRRAVASFYGRRGLETDESQIVVGPGSKALLFALMLALDGDLVVPRPAWVSYAAQASLAQKQVVRVPIPSDIGGIPDPEQLVAEVDLARAAGCSPRILLVTQPDNPTGTFPARPRLEAVLAKARSCGLFVISDEIYAELVHAGEGFTSAAAIDASGCVVTGGLSKSLALGGWRIGIARMPRTAFGRRLGERIRAIASEIWSCIPGPVQGAARLAYNEPPELVAHVDASRRLHAQVSRAMYATVHAAGAMCREPTAAFYLYPDLGGAREHLGQHGVDGSATLARALLDQHGIAVLPGDAFGEDPRELRFRMATSLLYGRTEEERWTALEAASARSASELPAVADAAARLQVALQWILAGH